MITKTCFKSGAVFETIFLVNKNKVYTTTFPFEICISLN